MPGYPSGVQLVGTVTLGASGDVNSSGSIFPVRSNAPFRDLSLTVRPAEDPSPYKVEVFFDNELQEEHDYPTLTDKTITTMSYPDFIFPANQGTNAIPEYVRTGYAPIGIPIEVTITNYAATTRVFEVYACFQILEGCQFGQIQQE